MKSWVGVAAAQLTSNFRAVQDVVSGGVTVVAVIKADAYGHGAALCAAPLLAGGAEWFGVTDVAEGVDIRRNLRKSSKVPEVENSPSILVMCGMEPADAADALRYGLTPVVWTPEHIAALDAAATEAGHEVRVHVEVDTGMARQGATVGAELDEVFEALKIARWVRCEGLMTHLCSAEVAGAPSTEAARGRFERAAGQTLAAGVRPRFVHVGNSSAVDEASTLQWLRRQADLLGASCMVRPGLALYGYCLPLQGDTSVFPALRARLRPVMTWEAPVIGLRDIDAGATVGYGASFIALRPMRLALLPVGYADGFRREASSGMGDGWVMLRGRRAPVVGRVSMNLTVVDVTAGAEVRVGD